MVKFRNTERELSDLVDKCIQEAVDSVIGEELRKIWDKMFAGERLAMTKDVLYRSRLKK